MTRPVTLPPDLEAFAEARVEAGDYASVDEVVRAGIDLLRERANRRARLDALIDEGARSAESERVYTAEESLAEIDEILLRATGA
jgi:putative addiction module CopG family antidote